MTTVDLKKIGLRHSPLSDSIYLCRFGKDPCLALDKRDAEADAVTVLVEYMMHDAPKGSKKSVQVNGEWYELQVRPLPK